MSTSALERIKVILVSPAQGGNVGSVCRVMRNMGLQQLGIVSPLRFDQRDARIMACHSQDILERQQIFPTLGEAVAECGMVVGTSAREGSYRNEPLTPKEIVNRIASLPEQTKVALVFGPEESGLTNEELGLCTDLVRIPTAAAHTSLNLSHAVLILCYELFIAQGSSADKVKREILPAANSVREALFAAWEELLLESEFIGELNREHMMLRLRKIASRLEADDEDLGILSGIARQIKWKMQSGH